MDESKVYTLLGFAQRSGALASGETAVASTLRRGSAKLLVMATDVSKNTEERLIAMAEGRSVPIVRFGTKASLGLAVGKAQRAALAVLDAGFARSIRGVLREGN